MEDIAIREMVDTDIPSVIVIERISFSTPWSETSFFNEVYNPKSTAKVAVMKDSVVGYICANQVADEGHILNLAVRPDLRRRGIAKALVRDILAELKENECRFIYLEVRMSNLIAIELYTRLGFVVVGTRKQYYNEPKEDAVIMMFRI